tara:strand:+ start:1392 stop:2561 length:1170 start_codon:yes stop_codon:yes gene_type:complete
MEQFTKKSIDYLKNNNEFIPPKNSRDILFDNIKSFIKPNHDILEPCAKTGEFIYQLLEIDISFNLTVLEENKTLFDNLKDISNCNVYNNNFLKISKPHNFKKFDLIIGSPPSYTVDKKTHIGNQYKHWFVDKTDIYSFYFMRAIDLLKNNGVIAFIIPDSILNSQYLQLLRNKISTHGSIIFLQRLSNLFTKTTYNTILIGFQKNKTIPNKYIYLANKQPFFHINPSIYSNIFLYSTFFSNLDIKINNGIIPKNISNRTRDNKCIPIIYTKNIKDNSLELYNNSKQFIHTKYSPSNPRNKPSLIISKFYGNNDNEFKINYTLCTLDYYFCNDNLFVITFPKLNNEDSIILISKIIKSFEMKETREWERIFLKDGLISKFQIKYYLPLFI